MGFEVCPWCSGSGRRLRLLSKAEERALEPGVPKFEVIDCALCLGGGTYPPPPPEVEESTRKPMDFDWSFNHHWLRKWLRFEPHHIIGGADRPYMWRWYILPRNPWLNVYLHKFLRDDDDRALHDHPWWFVSWVIKGYYKEHREDGAVWRVAPSVAFRPAETRHRVELDRYTETGLPVPAWTIIVTGRVSREWGFWCPTGFKAYEDFDADGGCD